MENESRTGSSLASEQEEHLALKEYATFKLMQVLPERDTALLERNNAIAERKAAFAERDSAFRQRDIAFAERQNAILERDAAVAALELARGNRTGSWSGQKRYIDGGRREPVVLQMNVPYVTTFGGEEFRTFAANPSMMAAVSNCGVVQPAEKQSVQTQNKGSSAKLRQSRKKSKAVASETSKQEPKRKRLETQNQDLQPVQAPQEENNGHEENDRQQLSNGQVPYSGQEQTNDTMAPNLTNRPMPSYPCSEFLSMLTEV
eukprot:c23475_g1_i1 orf=278-1057(+)